MIELSQQVKRQDLPEPIAIEIVGELVEELEIIESIAKTDEMRSMVQPTLAVLRKPGVPAAAKLKLAIPLVPGFVAIELEGDMESVVRRLFSPLVRTYKNLKKNSLDEVIDQEQDRSTGTQEQHQILSDADNQKVDSLNTPHYGDDSSGCGLFLIGLLIFGGVAWFSNSQSNQEMELLGTYSVYCPKGESEINLRKNPVLSPNTVIQKVTCGENVEVTGKPQQGDNEIWLPVTFKSRIGFIVKKHLVKKASIQK